MCPPISYHTTLNPSQGGSTIPPRPTFVSTFYLSHNPWGSLFSSQSSLIGDIHLKPQVQHRGTLVFLEEMSETTKMDEVLEIFQKAIDHPSVGHHPPPPSLALTKYKIYCNFSETHEQKLSVRDE